MAYHDRHRHKRNSNYWGGSSPAGPDLLDSRVKSRLEYWRPSQHSVADRSGELLYPRHEQYYSRYWERERSYPTPNILHGYHDTHPSNSKRHFGWRSSKHSLNRSGELEYRLERSSTTPNLPVPQLKRTHFNFRRSSKHNLDRNGGNLEYPRHNRHTKYWERSSPTPNLQVPQIKRVHLEIRRPSEHSLDRNGRLEYPEGAITRWFAADLDGDNRFLSSIHLKPVLFEVIGQRRQEKSYVLLNNVQAEDDDERKGNTSRSPWDFVAENVWPDLLATFEILRSKMECQELEEVKPILVAKFGKTLFHVNRATDYVSKRKAHVSQTDLDQLRKTFYTNVPTLYIEKLMREVVPKLGLDFDEEKDIYHVRLFDRTRSNSIISCKCRIKEYKGLELYQVKLIHQIRHMVIDISCLNKNLDLRLMLSGKRILTALTDDEMNRIRNLINSVVLDPEVKGGLRWPEVEAHSGSDRYSIVGVWHTITKGYKSPSLRLKIRHADRYNFETARGVATIEVSLKFKGIVSALQELNVEFDSVYDMFNGTLAMIWDNFLCCEQFLT